VDIRVRPIEASDRERWAELFRGYREFYGLAAHNEAVVDRVWGWLMNDANEVNAFVADRGGELVGIAHYRRFSRPSNGTVGIYLDDLFTAPDARGHGIGRALIAALRSLASDEGRSVVRWMTAEGNTTARRLYDSVATLSPFVTYDLTPES
jgi:GNAT superfamily N-acetyltransferase